MAKPSILTIASTFPRWPRDSEPSFVLDLACSLKKKFSITVLAPHCNGAEKNEIIDAVKVVRFQYFLAPYQKLCYEGGIHENIRKSLLARLQIPFFVFFEFAALYGLCGKRYKLIHAHWILPHGLLAVVMKKIFGIPVVISVHAGDVFPLRNHLLKNLAGWTLRRADSVTVNSTATKNAVIGIAQIPVQIIPMGVDIAAFSKSRPRDVRFLKKNLGLNKIVLSVGRLAEKKGIHVLIMAFQNVLESFPHATLVIVGDGPEKPRLEALVKRLGLEHSVIFTGRLSRSRLAVYFAAADVFALPSIVAESGDTEGLGVVLLESLASGIPAVASRVGGTSDVIKDGKTGLLVEQKNPRALSEAIIKLMGDKKLRQRVVNNGKEHVRKNFSQQVVGEKFSKLFMKILC